MEEAQYQKFKSKRVIGRDKFCIQLANFIPIVVCFSLLFQFQFFFELRLILTYTMYHSNSIRKLFLYKCTYIFVFRCYANLFYSSLSFFFFFDFSCLTHFRVCFLDLFSYNFFFYWEDLKRKTKFVINLWKNKKVAPIEIKIWFFYLNLKEMTKFSLFVNNLWLLPDNIVYYQTNYKFISFVWLV